jgi:hypothetical protein
MPMLPGRGVSPQNFALNIPPPGNALMGEGPLTEITEREGENLIILLI